MRILVSHEIAVHKRARLGALEAARARFPLLDKLLFRLPQGLIDRIFDDRYTMNERVAEVPFLFRALSGVERGARILDAGCNHSLLSIQLATAGYKVYGVDVNDYPFSHPNFSFVKGSVCALGFGDGFFDAVTAVSMVEHIGLGHYGDGAEDSDLAAMAEMRRVLRPGGLLVLTLPYGLKCETSWFRVYNCDSLAEICAGFETLDSAYFLCRGEQYWESRPREELAGCGLNERNRNLGCACLLLRKV